LLRQADARGSADVIYRTLLCGSGKVVNVIKYVTNRIFNTNGQYY